MGYEAVFHHVADATSQLEKFKVDQELAAWVGICGLNLTQLVVANGLEEPVSRDRVKVGKEKLAMFAPRIEHELKAMSVVPDAVKIMDVLSVADILQFSDEQAVLKKPEEEPALDALTAYFAMCRAAMLDTGMTSLPITYSMVQAIAPVDQARRKIELHRTRVGFDSLEFNFSPGLVALLSDPDALRDLHGRFAFLDRILTHQSIAGFKIQNLIPSLVNLAAIEQNDGLSLDVMYLRACWGIHVDQDCQLEEDAGVKVSPVVPRNGSTLDESFVPLNKFVYWAVKNSSPWLAREMLAKKGKKKR